MITDIITIQRHYTILLFTDDHLMSFELSSLLSYRLNTDQLRSIS